MIDRISNANIQSMIETLRSHQTQSAGVNSPAGDAKTAKVEGQPDFFKSVQNALDSVNETQLKSSSMQDAYDRGEEVPLTEVVLSGGRTISPAHLMFDDAQMDEQAMPAIQAALPVAQEAAVAAPVVAMPVTPSPVAPAMPAAPVAYNPMAYTAAPFAPVETRETPVNLDSAVKASELQVIMAAIQSTDSRMEAAAKLGISPRTLRYKLAQMRTRGMNEGASA